MDETIKNIDSHCHIASEEHTPLSFIEGSVANMVVALKAQGIPVSPRKLINIFMNKMQDPLGDQLVAEMEAAGISKSVLLIADFTYALKDCRLSIAESFDRHREVMLRHPGKFDLRWS